MKNVSSDYSLEGECSAKRCRIPEVEVELSDLPDEILIDVISRLPLKGSWAY